jgi:hypothetical protein
MKNTHGGKRGGASRPKLEYKTKEIRRRINSFEYKTYARKNEIYDQFFDRIETAVLEAIQKELKTKKL